MTTHRASQSQPMPPRSHSCLVTLGILIAGIFIFYWGYCWGWWMRNNLLAQALFQCNCPAISETARYAPFEVLVSACEEPAGPSLSLSHTQLVVRIPHASGSDLRAVHLETAAQRTVVADIRSHRATWDFLSDDLIFLRIDGDEASLISIHESKSWPISQTITYYHDGLRARRNSIDQAILLNYATILLVKNYQEHPEGNLAIMGNRIQKEAVLPDIVRLRIPYSDLRGWPTYSPRQALTSETGQWDASETGIADHQTGRIVVQTGQAQAGYRKNMRPLGWVAEDAGVVYFRYDAYLFDIGTLTPRLWKVPQPVLLLRVPSESKP
jgi:hypothetical protein